MKIKKLVNRLNEFSDAKIRNHNEQCRHLKMTLRQLKMAAKKLEKKIQTENRKGNAKILHEKHKIVTMQRKKGLSLLKALNKSH